MAAFTTKCCDGAKLLLNFEKLPTQYLYRFCAADVDRVVIREGCLGEVQNGNTTASKSNEHGADVLDIADSKRFDVDGDFIGGISLHNRHSIGPQRLNLREVSHGPSFAKLTLHGMCKQGRRRT